MEIQTRIDKVMKTIYEFNPENSNGSNECMELCNLFFDLVVMSESIENVNHKKSQLDLLNKWFSEIRVETLKPLLATALLRYSFCAKNKIKCWNDVRDKVVILLEKNNKDPKKLLKGLM